MRLATVVLPGGERRAAVAGAEEGTVHLLPAGTTVRDLVAAGLEAARERAAAALAGPAVPLDGLAFDVPLEPASVRDFVAFEEHVEGVRRSVDGVAGVPEEWYAAPTFYFTNPHALLPHDAEVEFPATSTARDFELEVAVVVGAEGRSLTPGDAARGIFGFTLMNDWSARDLQRVEMKVGLGPAKGKDFATSLGPWLVTADEVADRTDDDGLLDLAARVSVNGRVVGEDRLSHMGWGFGTLIAYASRDSRVLPGDVLGSGTTGGGGCLAELWGRRGRQDPPPLRDGDVVEITVERLGTLRGTVATAAPAPDLPAARRRVHA